jgi:UDP-N-acetylmuramoyl-tripeptide--D-alanyl-D-alanine ligase
MIRKIVVFKLNLAARILLRRMNPEVIAITGSAGKTTTKEIIKNIFSTEFDVLAPVGGYNTEIGAPLALFEEQAPINTKSISAWLGLLFRCYKKAILTEDYPDKVIMEFSADAPGDIKYLVKTFKPDKGVVLTVLPVHLEKLINIESIAKEKGELALGVKKGGAVFLNSDNIHTLEMPTQKGVQRVTFGKNPISNYQVLDLQSDIGGLSFKLKDKDKEIDFKVRLYGKQMIYPVLAAIAVARKDHISYKKIKMVLNEVEPFKGRMNVIEGIKGSIIIDDSYNANPESMLLALDFLASQKGRRIALLGNMNELGDYEKEGHELVGRQAPQSADLLITVGNAAEKYLAEAAIAKGFLKSKVKCFDDAISAGKHLRKIIREDDIILAKGSQNNVRLEKALELIMKDSDKKREILVRQGEEWQNR